MANEIVYQIKKFCEEGVEEPNIYTEFGSFTVGESAGNLYKIISQKRQNDREKWNMIDSSFMTTLPDSWAISKRFIMFPLNRWEDSYERVFLGGLTCDSDDYYNSEQHANAIYLQCSAIPNLCISVSLTQELIKRVLLVLVEFITVYCLSQNIFSSKKLKTENYNTKFSAKNKTRRCIASFRI
jgi:arginine decarboxylase-like protein